MTNKAGLIIILFMIVTIVSLFIAVESTLSNIELRKAYDEEVAINTKLAYDILWMEEWFEAVEAGLEYEYVIDMLEYQLETVQAGLDGIDGVDGVGIGLIIINEDGELVITLTDETVINLGNVVGSNGQDGQDGQNSILNVYIESGRLTFELSDGTIVSWGSDGTYRLIE